MLIYNQAYDIYHTMFRILQITEKTEENLEVDKLRILDFYLAFPTELLEIKSFQGFKKYEKHIKAESMFNTPPVFPVYASLLTLQWLKKLGGIAAIEKINEAKANLLYTEIDRKYRNEAKGIGKKLEYFLIGVEDYQNKIDENIRHLALLHK